jgi:hydrogenase expression/formation protein HypC
VCVAVPGRVLDVYDDRGMAMAGVDVGGARREVCLELVPEAGAGDWVLVHLGTALQCMDERTAAQILDLLTEAGLLGDGAVAPAGP